MKTGSGKRIAIVQSNYIPWKGYFDLIGAADEVVLYDDRQYTRRDWRNRNRIKTPQGVRWLTIPVEVKGRYHQRIDETHISDTAWASRHWRTITWAYAAAPHFHAYADRLELLYETCAEERRLSHVNRHFLEAVCNLLGIDTPLRWSTEFEAAGDRTNRLVEICLQAEADEYLSGPGARAYLDEDAFERAGIRVRWMDYSGYPEYPQLHQPFDHAVTILDLLLHVGTAAQDYMKAVRLGAE